MNYHDQKIWPAMRVTCKHWTAISTLVGLIRGVYHNLSTGVRTSAHEMQNAQIYIHIYIYIYIYVCVCMCVRACVCGSK